MSNKFFSFLKKMTNVVLNLDLSKKAKVDSTAIFLNGNIIIEDDVYIGPYCVISGNVKLSKGSRLINHVSISGNTEIGEATTIYPFASIGSAPQDIKYKGEQTYLIIGKNNVIREYVTINPGTEHGGFYTKIGNNNLFMISCHIGHDGRIGNNCIIANNVGIAGHVEIDDNVIIGGGSGIHQFVRIGQNVMIGGMSGVGIDIPPFTLYNGHRETTVRGLNIIGLKRHGFSSASIKNIRNAFDFIFQNSNLENNAKELLKTNKDEKVNILIDFIVKNSSRPVGKWDKNIKENDI